MVWALTGGSLPAGLSFNAGTQVLSGTPTTPGPSSFTFTVTNPVGSQQVTISLNVQGAPTNTTPVEAGIWRNA